MTYKLLPVTPADAPGVAEAHIRAFYEDARWRLSWPGMTLESIIAGNALRLPHALINNREAKRHQLAIDPANGEVVGYARWVLLDVPEDISSIFWLETQVKEATNEEAASYEAQWRQGTDKSGRPLGINPALRESGFGAILEAECNKITAGQPYLGKYPPLRLPLENQSTLMFIIELDHIGTLPSHARRGVGGLLLESGLKEADAAGLPVFVMAYPHGVGLYQKHGFELLGTVETDNVRLGGEGLHVVSFLARKVGGGGVSMESFHAK